MIEGIEVGDLAVFAASGPHRGHDVDGIDLVVQRFGPRGTQAVLAAGAVDANRVRFVGKEVHDRRAEQTDLFLARIEPGRQGPVEPHLDREALQRPQFAQRLQPEQIEEEKLGREGQVLLQQTVAGEGPRRIIEHGVFIGETDFRETQAADRRGPRSHRPVPESDVPDMVAQVVVEGERDRRITVEVEPQPAKVERFRPGLVPEPELQE